MRSVSPVIVSLSLALFACDFPSILSNENQPRKRDDQEGQSLVDFKTTGGLAGANRQMSIDESGRVTITDGFQEGAKWVHQLSGSQLNGLVSLFLQNGFSNLGEEYFDAQVADAFHYALTFDQNGKAKTVRTDGFAGPPGLREIVGSLTDLERKLRDLTLALDLELNSQQIRAGENVVLTLHVTNLTEGSLTLHFNSGQIFDFYAVRETTSQNAAPPTTFDWNWAHDKGFVQVLQDIELAAGESRSYQITWDGRNNQGSVLTGRFKIGAELVSVPGGRARHELLIIDGVN